MKIPVSESSLANRRALLYQNTSTSMQQPTRSTTINTTVDDRLAMIWEPQSPILEFQNYYEDSNFRVTINGLYIKKKKQLQKPLEDNNEVAVSIQALDAFESNQREQDSQISTTMPITSSNSNYSRNEPQQDASDSDSDDSSTSLEQPGTDNKYLKPITKKRRKNNGDATDTSASSYTVELMII